VYIRMLGNSVDSVGARDAGGAVRGALGQPRLLVPVVLVMAFNRWNG
jgi:ATP synthase protein I